MDDEDASVLRIAASLAAWNKSLGQETESVSDDAMRSPSLCADRTDKLPYARCS